MYVCVSLGYTVQGGAHPYEHVNEISANMNVGHQMAGSEAVDGCLSLGIILNMHGQRSV